MEKAWTKTVMSFGSKREWNYYVIPKNKKIPFYVNEEINFKAFLVVYKCQVLLSQYFHNSD